MIKKIFCILGITATAIALNASENLWQPPPKKLIGFGWDAPNPAYTIKNIETMEASAPFNGIGLRLDYETEINGHKIKCQKITIFQNVKWQKDWFKSQVDDLKNTKFKKFTDNFIVTTTSPGNMDWFDDEAWKNVCNNFGIMAWAAKEGKCKGILFDMEHYAGNRIFKYAPDNKHTYDETWDKARERGRQFMSAMTKEYPDLTLFTFFWLDLNYDVAESNAIKDALKSQEYGLSVAFINGIYDVLPAGAKIVEGDESKGYHAKSLNDYMNERCEFNLVSPRLLYKENLDKFRLQTSLAIPTYLDAYLNEKGIWVIKSDSMSRLELLRQNITLAMQYSGEYSWVWGEQCKWWPIMIEEWKEKKCLEFPGKGLPWEDAMPGITEALEYAQNPLDYACKQLEKGSLKNNLVKNSGFESPERADGSSAPPDCKYDKSITPWQTWQNGKTTLPKGIISLDKTTGCESQSSAKMSMVVDGSLLQSIPAKEGEIYFITASAKWQGEAEPTMTVRWRNNDRKWTCEALRIKQPFTNESSDGWKKSYATVTVPEGASYLTVLFDIKSSGKPDDICNVDNVQVYKLFQ